MAKGVEIDVVRNGTKTRITVDEAIEKNDRRGTCVSCGEPVRTHQKAKNGAAAHAEHIKRNPNCQLSDHL